MFIQFIHNNFDNADNCNLKNFSFDPHNTTAQQDTRNKLITCLAEILKK